MPRQGQTVATSDTVMQMLHRRHYNVHIRMYSYFITLYLQLARNIYTRRLYILYLRVLFDVLKDKI